MHTSFIECKLQMFYLKKKKKSSFHLNPFLFLFVCLLGIVKMTFSVFTDNVKLRNFTSKCFGTVSVSVNGSNYAVCYNELNKGLGQQVCKELGCGGLLIEKKGDGSIGGLLTNVECLGDEASLWHCLMRSHMGKCTPTTVICEGN